MTNPNRHPSASRFLLLLAALGLALPAQAPQAPAPREPAPAQEPAPKPSPARGTPPAEAEPKPAAGPTEPADAELDAAVRQRAFRRNAEGVALDGYDPVSYHRPGGPKPGVAEHALVHRGIGYQFASAENRKAFAADPDAFEPPYGGWCAYAVLDGDKVDVDPTNFAIENGKVLLFYKGFWGDALQKWQRLVAKQTAAKSVAMADEGWRRIETADREVVVGERKEQEREAAAKAKTEPGSKGRAPAKEPAKQGEPGRTGG